MIERYTNDGFEDYIDSRPDNIWVSEHEDVDPLIIEEDIKDRIAAILSELKQYDIYFDSSN